MADTIGQQGPRGATGAMGAAGPTGARGAAGDNAPVTLSGIKSWLPIIITVATLLISIGAFQGTAARYMRQVDANTERLDLAERQYLETCVKLARIETDLAYVRASVDKLIELHTAK